MGSSMKERVKGGVIILVLVILVLIDNASVDRVLGQGSNTATAQEADTQYDSQYNTQPDIKTVDIGSNFGLTMQFQHKPSGKLRISEQVYRYTLYNKLYRADPLAKAKGSLIEELVKCDNITLARQDRLDMLDCKSLDEHSINPYVEMTNPLAGGADVVSSNDPPTSIKFVHHIKTKYKHSARILFDSKSKYSDFHLYELRPDVVARNIENITAWSTAEHNFDVNDFGKNKFSKGYYFEWEQFRGTPHETICSGELYFVVNRTEMSSPQVDVWPDFFGEVKYLADTALSNGYLLSLKDVQCHRSSLQIFSLDTDFTIGQKNSFPYFMLNHTAHTSPLNLFLNYEAKIQQKKNETTPDVEGAYITQVRIRSRSGLFDVMNFTLDQTFNNINFTYGLETMIAITADYVLSVDSLWSPEKYHKHLFVYSSHDLLQQITENPSLDTLSSLTSLSYIDYPDSDHVLVAFRLRKSLLPFGRSAEPELMESYSIDVGDGVELLDEQVTDGPLNEGPSNDTKSKRFEQLLEKFPHHILEPLQQFRNEL